MPLLPLTEAARHAAAPLLPLLARLAQEPGQSLAAALALLALWQALRFLWWAAGFVYVYFLQPPIDPRSLGSWAVITGATDGIGQALSHRLAQKGECVVLLLVEIHAARHQHELPQSATSVVVSGARSHACHTVPLPQA